MRWILILTALMTAAVAGFVLIASTTLHAQGAAGFASSADARDALKRAEADLAVATGRAAELELQAEQANEAASKAKQESAALAARIQQSEAQITAYEAKLALIQQQQAGLDLRLAERRQPLMRLTAALQRLSRRPLTLSAFRSGSLSEAVYLRAMLASTMPVVDERTRGLREELAQSRDLAKEARAGLAQLQQIEKELQDRRGKLALLEAGQRQASSDARIAARREEERVFALAEEARDLDSLVGQLDRAGNLRRELASLHGPVLRPPRPGETEVVAGAIALVAEKSASLQGFRIPVTGRVISGFGVRTTGSSRAVSSSLRVIAL